MADVAEIVPESAVEMNAAESKGMTSICDPVESKVVEQGQGDVGHSVSEDKAEEAVTQTNSETETTEKCVEAGGDECKTETKTNTTEVVADTTEETPIGGTKRKSEDDVDSSEASDESKKVKTDDSEKVESSEPVSQSKEEPVVVNGNSVSENGCHVDAPDATNGHASDDIPPEIVTKTVEEAMNQPEDIAASS